MDIETERALASIDALARDGDIVSLRGALATLVSRASAMPANADRTAILLRALTSAVMRLTPPVRGDDRVWVVDRNLAGRELFATSLVSATRLVIDALRDATSEQRIAAFDALWPIMRRGFFDFTANNGAELAELAADPTSLAHCTRELTAASESWKNPRIRELAALLAEKSNDAELLLSTLRNNSEWSEHERLVRVFDATGAHERAIEWLDALPKSARRDELRARMLGRAGRSDESAAARHATLSPSQLTAEGLSDDAIAKIALARKKFTLGDDAQWLAFAAKKGDAALLEHVATRVHPQAIVDVLASMDGDSLDRARELAWIAVERLFKSNVSWPDEARARRCVRSAIAQLIARARDEKDRAKLVAKARKLAARVESTNGDWFTRQLAIELGAALESE